MWAVVIAAVAGLLGGVAVGYVLWRRHRPEIALVEPGDLALGGIAGVGQLQLLQPFFGLLLAGLLLHEQVPPAMILVTVVVVACVAGARRFSRTVPVRPAV